MSSDYIRLAKQINLNPQRVPRHQGNFTESFIKFLQLLYSPQEAALVKHLMPLPKFTSNGDLAEKTGMEESSVQEIMDSLHRKNCLVGMGNMYALPPIPILLNIHQFHTESGPDDMEAARLYLDFFIEKKYSRYYEGSEKGTPVFRAVPIEKTIQTGEKILTHEEAEQFIRAMEHDDFCLVPCPCRTRTEKLGIRECTDRFPISYCLMVGFTAIHFQMIGMGQKVTKDEAVDYVKEMIDTGLICCTDNAMTRNSIICLCCGCCCSQIRGRTRWDNPDSVAPSNFIPHSAEECIACGKCQKRCLLGAITIDREEKKVIVDTEKCIGCGVCAVTCSKNTLRLVRNERSEPFTSAGQMMKALHLENA